MAVPSLMDYAGRSRHDPSLSVKRNPKTCYIVCSAPRSGSNFYSSLLTATELAGRPEEHFDPWQPGQTPAESPNGLLYGADYVEGLVRRGTTENGVFGTKAQFNEITSYVGLARLAGLFPVEPKYLFLERRDVIGQAVSLAIARQTGQFFWNDPPQRHPTYNPDQIRCCLEEICNQNRGWRTHFWEHGIEPFHVLYEDLVSKTSAVILDTLQFLDVTVPKGFSTPRSTLKKMATSLNREWAEKFVKDTCFSRSNPISQEAPAGSVPPAPLIASSQSRHKQRPTLA